MNTNSEPSIIDPWVIEQCVRKEIEMKLAEGSEDLSHIYHDITGAILDIMLVQTRGNKAQCAKRLGIHRETLSRWCDIDQALKKGTEIKKCRQSKRVN